MEQEQVFNEEDESPYNDEQNEDTDEDEDEDEDEDGAGDGDEYFKKAENFTGYEEDDYSGSSSEGFESEEEYFGRWSDRRAPERLVTCISKCITYTVD